MFVNIITSLFLGNKRKCINFGQRIFIFSQWLWLQHSQRGKPCSSGWWSGKGLHLTETILAPPTWKNCIQYKLDVGRVCWHCLPRGYINWLHLLAYVPPFNFSFRGYSTRITYNHRWKAELNQLRTNLIVWAHTLEQIESYGMSV